jgi:hypothetical protein
MKSTSATNRVSAWLLLSKDVNEQPRGVERVLLKLTPEKADEIKRSLNSPKGGENK